MKQENIILVLFIIVLSFGAVVFYVLSAPTINHEQNAQKTASNFQYELKKVVAGLKVIPNKPKVGNVLVQGTVKDDQTLKQVKELAKKHTDHLNEIIVKLELEKKKTSPTPN